MIRSIIPPACLLFALAMAVVGFSMLAFGGPDVSVHLHEARAAGDELATDTFEADLKRRQTQRVAMIVLLFVGSGVMTMVGFGAMTGPTNNRH